ncbi:MAG TPA: class I SAM-dependent methyltransferase [Bryobacteraceae bacterium]|nr:class I SAM-dependent methyltransferase [Bryobacteraceae bacterium]
MIPPHYTRAYLRHAPLFAAIVRPVEAHLMNASGRIVEPCLDLGCGDGLFASIAFTSPVSVGIDADLPSLRRAGPRHTYNLRVAGRGEALPFKEGAFATIMSNSVLEHIPDLDATLAECRRVLKPRGRLLITTPGDAFGRLLLMHSLLRRAGFNRAAVAYSTWFNRHSRHFHTDSAVTWTKRLNRAGFEVAAAHSYLTPDAHRAFDVAHYLSVPGWLLHRLTGRWRVTRESWLQRVWQSQLHRLHARALNVTEGPYLFLDARKRS